MLNIITILAIVIGLIAIFMAWVASRKNSDLLGRLERVNERIGSLQQEIQNVQQQTAQEKAKLNAELRRLQGESGEVEETPAPAAVAPAQTPAQIREITPQALKARIDNGDDLVIVDMRQLSEYKSGHIPGAINIFVNDIPVRANTLPKDRDIVFQCWSGNTSLQASAYLIENGWPAERVASLSGGIGGWTRQFGMEGLEQET